MEKWIGWGLAGIAAVVAVVLATRSSSAAETGDLCLAKLPEPFKKQAADIIIEGDVARMESFAAQCDAKGWHCAAKELRAAAKKAVPEPYRTEWKKLIARAQTESSGQLVVDLQTAMIEARKRGFSIEAELKAAIGLVVPRVPLTDVKEEPLAGAVAASYGLAGDPPAFVDHMRRLATDLARGGYVRAAQTATDAAEGVHKDIDAAVAAKAAADAEKAKYEASCPGLIDKLPDLPFVFTKASGAEGYSSIRNWVKDKYPGTSDMRLYVASVLEDEAAKMIIADVASVDEAKKLYAVRDCLRAPAPLFPL